MVWFDVGMNSTRVSILSQRTDPPGAETGNAWDFTTAIAKGVPAHIDDGSSSAPFDVLGFTKDAAVLIFIPRVSANVAEGDLIVDERPNTAQRAEDQGNPRIYRIVGIRRHRGFLHALTWVEYICEQEKGREAEILAFVNA